jgi:hypothetical protein
VLQLSRTLAYALLLVLALIMVFARPVAAPLQGNYDAILWKNGRIDARRTVDRLAEAHVTTYAYLIQGGRRSAVQWHALPEFLVTARAAGITVWVSLVPPSEVPARRGKPDYAPYGLDYPAWATAISRLARDHANLTGFAIDDFGQNTPYRDPRYELFTPAYTAKVVAAARTHRPVRFWPVLLHTDLIGDRAIIDRYRDLIDGVIFPFRDSPRRNTTVTTTAEPQIRTVHAALDGLPMVVMVYTRRLSRTYDGPPTPAYVEKVMRTALGLAGQGVGHGVMTDALNLTGTDDSDSFAACYERVKALYGSRAPRSRGRALA